MALVGRIAASQLCRQLCQTHVTPVHTRLCVHISSHVLNGLGAPSAERQSVATRAAPAARPAGKAQRARKAPPSNGAVKGIETVKAPCPRGDADYFYSDAESFGELQLNAALVEALHRAGFKKPAAVQALAAPAILSKQDVVLAAETGSGKTLAYITPVASALLDAAADLDPERRGNTKCVALILCPNVALVQQVLATIRSLQDSEGRPLLAAAQVSSSVPPPFDTPDVVVTTPGGLCTLLREAGRHYGSLWSAEGLAKRVSHVVVDEADLLTTGGYAKDLDWILETMRLGDRRNVEAQVMAQLGMSEEQFARVPRYLKQACWEGGLPAMVQAGYNPPRPSGSAGGDGASTSGREDEEEVQYWARQYIFVAATMPATTKGDVGTDLKYRYPDAVWLSGELLHKSKPQISHTWRPVDAATWGRTLLAAVKEDTHYAAGNGRTLVFAKDVASADRVASVLSRDGVNVVVYHKSVSVEDRAKALEHIASADNAVMVSTDAAARGIDIPDVQHVVQADFATNAVDFLHRIGRTARAGREGKVTSLYMPENATLAEVLQRYIEAGEPIEGAFSRNRSFSKKVKEYGKFVPRGEAGRS